MVEISNSPNIEIEAATALKPFVVVGIPAFNEEKTIAKVVLESQKYADRVVVCDDGSSDLTGDIALRLGAEVVRHEKNLGYGAAIQTLFNWAREIRADILVTLDGDGQHDPSEIPNVIEPIVRGDADIAVGSRFVDKYLSSVMPWYRRAGIKFISRLVDNGTKQGVTDAQSGFRAYSSKCFDKLKVSENGMGASVEILINARKRGLRMKEVPAKFTYSDHMRNHVHNPVRHGASVIKSFLRLVVEDRPLLFLGIPGILFLGTGTFFGVWLFQLYGQENRIMTNVALASIAFVTIGLFALSSAITLYSISRIAVGMNKDR